MTRDFPERDRYIALCRCVGEGVVVVFWEPSEHGWEDDDISLSIWRDWQPNVFRWRIRQAWAVLTERESLGAWGVLLSRHEALRLAAVLNDFATRPNPISSVTSSPNASLPAEPKLQVPEDEAAENLRRLMEEAKP
jgi:hypothetical protein